MVSFPPDIAALINGGGEPDAVFHALMPALTKALRCDRALLFLREPRRLWSICAHGWWERPEHAFGREKGWRRQPANLAEVDPMFAEALRNPVALFIDELVSGGA